MTSSRFIAWFRFVLMWTLFLTGGVVLYVTGGLQVLVIGLFWGVGPALGMQNAVRRASADQCKKCATRMGSLLGYILLSSIALFPALVALAFGELLIAITLAIVIVFGISLVLNLCAVLFGPIKPPEPRCPS